MSNLEAGDTIVHVPLSAVISRPFVETALCSHLKVSNLSTQVLFWEDIFFSHDFLLDSSFSLVAS